MRRNLIILTNILLFLFFSSSVLYAQSEDDLMKEDSTLKAIELYKEKGDNLAQSESYLSLIKAMISLRNFDKVEKYLKAGMEVMPDDAPNKIKGQYLHWEGYLAQQIPDYDEAERLYLEAEKLLKNNDEAILEYGKLLTEIGGMYTLMGNAEKGLELIIQSLSVLEKLNDPKKVLPTIYQISSTYRRMADYENALKYARKGLDISKKNNFLRDQGYYYNQMAILFIDIGETDKVKDNLMKSAACFGETGDLWMQNLIKGNIGNQLIVEFEENGDKSKLKEAEELYDEALVFFEGINDSTQMGYIFYYQAELHETLKETEKAAALYRKNIEFNLQKDKNQVSDSYFKLGELYLDAGKLDEAYAAAQNVMKFSKEVDYKRLTMNGTLLLSNIEKERRDFETALDLYDDYFMQYDSIKNEKADATLQKEKVTQDVEGAVESQKEAELQAELLSSRNTLFGTIAAALLGLLILGIYFYRKLQKSRKEIASQNLQLQELNATKDKFFGIIAHDIRSPIVALDGVGDLMEYYVKKDDKDKLKRLAGRVDSTAKQLGGLLDNLLKWALLQQGVIPYHPKSLSVDEVTQNTLAMFQNNAEAKGVKLRSNIDASLKVNADESALNTILRNIVSNAIKFTPSGGTVSISTEMKNEKVFININDTGTGISAEKLKTLFTLEKKSEKGTAGEKGTGLGLTLVKELAELNKGILNVSSQLNEGSQFSVGLPMAA